MPDQESEKGITRRAFGSRFLHVGAGVLAGASAVEALLRPDHRNSHCGGTTCVPRAEAADWSKPLSFERSDGAGWHFAMDRWDDDFYPSGYTVPYATMGALGNFGGIDAVGFPESRLWTDKEDKKNQLFRTGIFQMHPEGLQGWFRLFDWFASQGWDGWLHERLIPPKVDFARTVPPDVIRQRSLAMLEDAPEIKQAYFASNPLWESQYGLPTGIEDFGDQIVVRTQNTVFRYSKVDGKVSIVNPSEILKEEPWRLIQLPKFPVTAVTMDLPPNYEDYVTVDTRDALEDDGRRLPENISGSDFFITQVRRVLDYMKLKAPPFYERLMQNVHYIRDSGNPALARAATRLRGISFYSLDHDLNEGELQIAVTILAHENRHVELYWERLQSGGVWGEFACLLEELQAAKYMRVPWLVDAIEKDIQEYHLTSPRWRRNGSS